MGNSKNIDEAKKEKLSLEALQGPSCSAGQLAEQRYRELLAAVPDLMFRIRRDGTFLDCHVPEGMQLWLDRSEMIGRRLTEVFPPEFAQRCMDVLERTFVEGTVQSFEYRGFGERSHERWEARFSQCGPDEVLALKREVTDKMRAEDELRSREHQLRTIFETAVDPLWDWDVATDQAVFSPSWPVMLGYGPHEYDPAIHTWESVLHPEDAPAVRSVLDRCLRNESDEYEAEYRVRHRSGRWIWAYSRGRVIERGPEGKPLRMVGAIRDMTERHEAENARREHERFLATLLSNLPGHVYRCRNDPNWTLEYASDGIEAITGYTPEDFLGEKRLKYGDLIVEEDRPRVWTDVQHAIARREQYQLTYRICTAGNEVKWMWEQGRAVLDEAGEVVALEGFVTDITSRMMAEEEARQSEERQRVLLRELDHRVRNNLASLIALVDITAASATDVRAFADAIRSRVRAMSTTHGLLTRSQQVPLDLCTLLASLLPPEVDGAVNIEGPQVLISSRQSTALGMVLQEILTNCLKYGSLRQRGGRVEVTWRVSRPHEDHGAQVDMIWRESGGPAITAPPRPGVGTTLINGLVRAELRGVAELTYPESGAVHRLCVVLDSTEEDPLCR